MATAVGIVKGVATLGGLVLGAKSVREGRKAREQQDEALAAQREAEAKSQRIAQVNNLRQLTYDGIGNVNAKELIDFDRYAIENPENVDEVSKRSKEAIHLYQERTGTLEGKSVEEKPTIPEKQEEPLQDMNGFVRSVSNTLRELMLDVQRSKTNLTTFVNKPSKKNADPINKNMIIVALLLIGGVFFLRSK